jgi:F-type H+-transporting ATPase subunit a
MKKYMVPLVCLFVIWTNSLIATSETAATEESGHATHHEDCSCHHEEAYDPGAIAFHHIADANAFHLFGDYYLPLPCLVYSPESGFKFFMSHAFHLHHHGTGTKAIDGYVMVHGNIMRVNQEGFPMDGEVEISCFTENESEDGKERQQVIYEGKCYNLDKKTSFDGGIMGGGVTSFYDFSLTKNVFTMILAFLVLFFLFRKAAVSYISRKGQAPKGVQAVIEPLFEFIRNEVAIPFLGSKYEKYLPYLMSVFFFILGLNLIGQLPFFPGSGNVTGNLSVTLVLAVIAALITNFSGNKHYWQHVFNMPGVPLPIKFILTPVEIFGLFIKPMTLMLRLFANITAGHIVIIIFVSLIFIFGQAGESLGGSILGGVMAIPLTLFMMTIELLVAFVQAFVFCVLTASYIGAAVEEHHEHH